MTRWSVGRLAAIVAFFLLIWAAPVVTAHALMVGSKPANGAILDDSPELVVATFSQELDSALSSMRVFDGEGRQVDNGDGGVDLNDLNHLSMVVSLPPLPAGAYTVRWNVLSVEDGDDTEGAFAFTLGSAAAAPETTVQPADSSSNLIVGAIIAGALLLLALIVIYVRRRQTAPVDR